MKKYVISVNEDDILFLQKYNYEVIGYSNLLEKMATANSTNSSILESETWQTLFKQYQEANIGYDMAKKNFTEDILKPIIYQREGKEVDFNWELKDLLKPIVDISIFEE